jgi:hypothetical protein
VLCGQIAPLSGIVAGARPALLYGQVTLSLSGFIATFASSWPALLCSQVKLPPASSLRSLALGLL